ncbi:MAG: hypothetical protein R3A45_09835 [Bdellovibrionota bacterium]
MFRGLKLGISIIATIFYTNIAMSQNVQVIEKLFPMGHPLWSQELADMIEFSNGEDAYADMKKGDFHKKIMHRLKKMQTNCEETIGCGLAPFVANSIKAVEEKGYTFVAFDHIDSNIGIPKNFPLPALPMLINGAAGALTVKEDKKVFVHLSVLRIFHRAMQERDNDKYGSTEDILNGAILNELYHIGSDFRYTYINQDRRKTYFTSYYKAVVDPDNYSDEAEALIEYVSEVNENFVGYIAEEIASEVVNIFQQNKIQKTLTVQEFAQEYKNAIYEMANGSFFHLPFSFLGITNAWNRSKAFESIDAINEEAKAYLPNQYNRIFSDILQYQWLPVILNSYDPQDYPELESYLFKKIVSELLKQQLLVKG